MINKQINILAFRVVSVKKGFLYKGNSFFVCVFCFVLFFKRGVHMHLWHPPPPGYGLVHVLCPIFFYITPYTFINFVTFNSTFNVCFVFPLCCVNFIMCLFHWLVTGTRCFVNFWIVIYLVINEHFIPVFFSWLVTNRVRCIGCPWILL